ncbi:MAG: outer membrane beta-barrel protein [Bacteroidales bacterium]|nr:outer membrane beta-barrel protein [Bacteroidales bacterium]
MKRTILFTILLLLVTAAQAQRIHAYVAAGATVSQVEGDELKGFKKWGGTAGVGAMVRLTENGRWKMSVEADFAQRGFRNNIKHPESYVTSITLNYIDIPVVFHFHDNKGGLEVGAGILYGRLVKQPHGTLEFPSTFVPDTSNMEFLKNDFAALLDLRFTIWRGLQLNLRFQYSIIPIKKDWEFYVYTTDEQISTNNPGETRIRDCRNISIGARLIYEFGTGDDNGIIGKRSRKKR